MTCGSETFDRNEQFSLVINNELGSHVKVTAQTRSCGVTRVPLDQEVERKSRYYTRQDHWLSL